MQVYKKLDPLPRPKKCTLQTLILDNYGKSHIGEEYNNIVD